MGNNHVADHQFHILPDLVHEIYCLLHLGSSHHIESKGLQRVRGYAEYQWIILQ